MSSIITINDNNLLVQQGDKLSTTQGFAWLPDDKVYFDFDDEHAAIKVCRLQPQQIHSRYWQQCSQTSIGISSDKVRNSADLIWRHLSAIREAHQLKDAVLIVPSHYQADNLELLLGIANSSGIQPQGLFNKAVLAAQHFAREEGNYIHIDMQLHQTVCSSIEVRDGIAKLQDIDVLGDVSIQAIQDALLKAMQQQFIQSDRFDPLHYAETEQQLFDQLVPTTKALSRDGKAMVVVQQKTHSYNIAIDNNQWNAVITPFAEKLFTHSGSDSATRFLLQLNKAFGGAVAAPFKHQRCTIVDDAMMIKSDLHIDAQIDDGFSYVTELALLNKSEPKKAAANLDNGSNADLAKPKVTQIKETKAQTETVSHLMQSGTAVPVQHATLSLEGGQLTLTRSGSSNLESLLSKEHVFILNDAKRRSVQLNDRIGSNHADGVITAISVLE